MFNKERFHNQLALNLGCERLLRNSRYEIKVEYKELDNPVVSIMGPSSNQKIVFNALDANRNLCDNSDLIIIVDAVHQAYIQATSNPF